MGKNTKQDTITQPAPAVVPVALTEGEKIWNEIKDKDILMFSLPGQKIADYCAPVTVDPSRCFLLYKASSVLPSLEESIGKNYECEAVDKYIIVSRKKNAF